jgi:hypothetical protein
LHAPGHAGDAFSVVAHRPQHTGTNGAVAVIVIGVACFVDRGDTVDIVNVAIVVVIDAVAGDFSWINPHISSEVLVGITDARINDRDDNAGGGRL